jgi:hypothetical protein
MKDFVREYWKIAAAFAVGAFLLSFLVGLVTGNPFGVVILRALLLTVIFAGFGAGLRFVIRKYLPEITSAGGFSAEGERGETRGTKIDIVLPEERPDQRPRAGSRESGRRAPAASAASQQGQGEETHGAMDEDTAFQAEAAALDDLAEELAEELPAAGTESAQEREGEAYGQEEQVEELRPMGREKGRAEQTAGGGEGDAGAEGDLDSLPDISTLEIAEEPGSGSSSARPGRRPGGETPEDAMRGAVSGQDPASIARAIRTVLKRDEKG